jgi:hypothetical protein
VLLSLPQDQPPSRDPDRRAVVLVFFLSGAGEAGLLEHTPARRPIQRRVPDDSFDTRN